MLKFPFTLQGESVLRRCHILRHTSPWRLIRDVAKSCPAPITKSCKMTQTADVSI
ncbi:hypothetical protein [Rosistilla oblonga]|uniref:hypothetical protein n=1 Tax=Rosistilla oblonga TaxID=2527990 RepID=UPI003A979724